MCKENRKLVLVARKLTEQSARHLLEDYFDGYGTICVDFEDESLDMLFVEYWRYYGEITEPETQKAETVKMLKELVADWLEKNSIRIGEEDIKNIKRAIFYLDSKK